jgi:hypothetical protein
MTLAKNIKMPYEYPGLEEVQDPCRNEIENFKGLNDLAKIWTGTHDTCSIGSMSTWQNSFCFCQNVFCLETIFVVVVVHLCGEHYDSISEITPLLSPKPSAGTSQP